MWANARSKAEKKLYCRKIGEVLFDNPDLFGDREKFTLAPLHQDGEASLVCHDLEGIEWVKLREVEYRKQGLTMVLKSANLFATLRPQGLPEAGTPIDRAKFQVKFSDARAPRMVSIQRPNRAQYTRDSDSILVEQWLERRGFLLPRHNLQAVA